jgi:hypothetical protein
MAVKATFAADFSSFTKAVREAETHLGELEVGANQVQRQLTRIGDSFAGSKLIQEATLSVKAIEGIGGATKLTADEQKKVNALVTEAIAKYSALGQTAPPEMLALADATKQTESSWQKLGSIDIAGAFSDPLGTAKEAMSAFGGEMAVTIGIAAGVATAIGAVVLGLGALTVAAAEADAELDDMADVTGLSVPALSRLSNAAKVIGADMGQLTAGLFEFEKRLADASPEFVAGLQKMGYSLEQVRAMKPDEYYPLIAEGLSKITNQSEKAATAANIFGKSARDLVPVVNDLQKGFEATADMDVVTAEQAEAAENFQIQLNTMIEHVKDLGLSIGRVLVPAANLFLGVLKDYVIPFGQFVGNLTGLPQTLHLVAEGFRFATAAWDVFNKKMPDTSKMAETAEAGLEKMRGSVNKLKLDVPDLDKALRTAALAEIDLNAAAQASIKSHTDAAAAQKKQAEEVKKTTDKVRELEAGFFGLTTSVGQADTREQEFVKRSIAMRAELDKVEQTAHIANFGFKGMADSLEQVGEKVRDLGPDIAHQFVGPIQEATVAAKGFGQTLKESLGNLPKTLMAAFTGGGGISGALNAFGAELGGALFGPDGTFAKATASATKGLTSVFGKTIGGALGAAIPGIGALIGPGLQALWGGIKKLFGGPSEAELEGRKTVQAFEQQLAGLMTAQQRAEAGGRQWAATTIAVRDAFLATGRSAAEAEQVVLRLWDTKNPAAYKGAIEEINAAFKLQNDAYAALDEAVKRYGFSIEELGPAMQRQQLDQQAQQLYSDWQLLNSAGIDTVAIATRMSDSVNEYIHNALKMGAEVPAAMKPMLDQMAKQGQLTDLAGNKIENLEDSGIDFSVTMTEGFKMMVESVDKLTKVIAQSLNVAIDDTAAAIANIPTDVTVNIHYNDPGLPVHEVPVAEVPGFQHGTRGRFLNFGKGALAMLHGREAIVPEGQSAGMSDEHLAGLRQDITELKQALLAEQRLAPERLTLALRGVLALAR